MKSRKFYSSPRQRVIAGKGVGQDIQYTRSTNVGYSSELYTRDKVSGSVGSDHDTTTALTRSVLSDVNTITGVRNPNWRSQVKRGLSATTTCSGKQYTYDKVWVSSGYTYVENAPPHIVVTREWYGYPSVTSPGLGVPSGSTTTNVHNRLLRKFYDALRSARSSVELGQDLGEYRETIKGILRPMHSMQDLINGYYAKLRKLKQIHHGKPVSLRKALADSYLEWTFGWRPLALDVADAYSGLRNRSKFLPSKRFSVSASDIFQGSSTPYVPSGLPSNLSCTKTVQSRYQERVEGAVKVNLVNGNVPVLDVLELSKLSDFATTAWDLLPYSFVIDYFTNIGDIISSLVLFDHDVMWTNWTTRTTTTEEYQYRVSGLPVPITAGRTTENYVQGGNSKQRVTSFTRSPSSLGGLIPSFRFSLPNSDKPWVNIAALVLGGARSLVPFF